MERHIIQTFEEDMRKKVKWKWVPREDQFRKICELLELDPESIIQYIPVLGKYQDLEDVYRLRCNKCAQDLTESLKRLPRRILKEMYSQVFPGENFGHKTFAVVRLVYTLCAGIGLCTERMESNWIQLLHKGPEGIVDLYGGSYKKGVQLKYRKKGGKKDVLVKQERVTVKNVITAFLQLHEEGVTRQQLYDELRRRLPERDAGALWRTLGVQLSYHLKKEFGDNLRRIQDRWVLRG